MKTYKELAEDLWDDIKKNIIKNGEVYELVSNIIMLSKWTGIKKSVAPHVKVLVAGTKVYMMKYDIRKKQVSEKAVMESTDLKVWKKIVSANEVKKI